MAEDSKQTGKPDDARINVVQDHEVKRSDGEGHPRQARTQPVVLNSRVTAAASRPRDS
jgi:hypothetical protein